MTRRPPALLSFLLVCSHVPLSKASALSRRPDLVALRLPAIRLHERKSLRKTKGLPFQVSLPWIQPKRKPTPLVVLRQSVVSVCRRTWKKLRRWAEDVVVWWHMDQELDRRWLMRALFLVSNAAYMIAGFGLLERTVSRGCPV